MKIVIVYNRNSRRVINFFGVPNRERYALKSIKRIANALQQGGHQVKAFEGDKDLIANLESFMPRVLKGERPGLVFNLSYGIQGQARYTHVPGILEMLGLPYVGSGPLAHSLALDKVISKMLFRQHGLPTPDFTVVDGPDFALPDLPFPLIVKPKHEAVSFGLRIVEDEKELREGVQAIFDHFHQPVLVERYIPGREINVGLLGNNPPDALPPAELVFGPDAPQIYTYEDKVHRSGREVRVVCPAALDEAMTHQAQDLARRAFAGLGGADCGRVDMRLDEEGRFSILEMNSLPSLGEHGSFVQGAHVAGLDFPALVNRLVEVASARYFGTPSPPSLEPRRLSPKDKIFHYLTSRRDAMEKHLQVWCRRRSYSGDPVAVQGAAQILDQELQEIGLRLREDLSDKRHLWTWEGPAGLDGGTLLIGHLDVPIAPQVEIQVFRREAEWLHGEGIASSRAPLVAMQFALRALKHARLLAAAKVGVLYYGDEGQEARASAAAITETARHVRRVLVLRPGNSGDQMVMARRGQRRYQLNAEGSPMRPGKIARKPEVLRWMFERLEQCSRLSSRKERVAVAVLDLRPVHLPQLLPHRAVATLLVSYPDPATADRVEGRMRELLTDSRLEWQLRLVSDRPPMKERKRNDRFFRQMLEIASGWDIPLARESSVWPSVAGLIPPTCEVLCGVGPVGRDLYMPSEGVHRTSLIQRSLLMAQLLGGRSE